MTTTVKDDLWVGQEYLSAAAIRQRVHALAPLLRDQAEACNSLGHLTDEVKQALGDAGVWRINFPAEWGGPAMRIDDQIELVEEIARIDASIAWNVMLLSDAGVYASRLESPEVAHALYPTMDLATSTTGFPVGRAQRVDGGYHVSGKWTFASGIYDADRVLCGFHKFEADGQPVARSDGRPVMWEAWIPRDQVEIHDTWQTTGLAGTGSASFSVQGVVIPESHLISYPVLFPPAPDLEMPPLARYSILLSVNQIGVVLGLARHALDEFRVFIEKSRSTSTQAAKTEPSVLAALAEAEGRYGAARAYAMQVYGEISDALFADQPLTSDQEGSSAAAMPIAARLSRDAVELCLEAAGSRAVLASNPFDLIYRDMSTAIRHLLFRPKTYELAGRRFLGSDEGGLS